MNYTINDNLSKIRVGDTLTLENGTIHEVVKDNKIDYTCNDCSIFITDNKNKVCNNSHIGCGFKTFHFKQIKP